MRNLVLLTALAAFLSGGTTATAQDEKKATEKKEAAKPKIVLSDAEKAAVAAIKKLGGSVLEVAQDDGRLDVAYHLTDGKVEDKHLAPVKALKHIYSLNLRGTEITDGGLAQIALSLIHI